ncbi:MAG: tRNA (guanosine(46)-N7)-methyltransferase TrmB [Promicromonosporaceae bacterium]|nr:tRNA (guanosine(46)-N7)-methyltransferase TrmB [Promicromonosporaceae bacterium]
MTEEAPKFWRRTVSYVRRTERLTEAQQRAWDHRRDAYLVEVPRGGSTLSVDPRWVLDPAAVFGRRAPLVVEIGTGRGENVVAAAAREPGCDFLGVEVYTPGVAQAMVRADKAAGEAGQGGGLGNLRLLQVDAALLLETSLAPGSVDELWIFFSDPWPKKKHHKRRLVSAEFLLLCARVLKPGGVLRLATDWENYAEQMLELGNACPALRNEGGDGAFSPRFEGRVLTAFEQRGINAGRAIHDLTYRRV